MTLVETIIALIVLFVAIAAILVTVAQAAQMIARSREDLGTYTFASNWMELIEAQPPETLSNNIGFNLAVENVATMMDPNQSGSGTTRTVSGYQVTASRSEPEYGLVDVTVTVRPLSGTLRQAVHFTKELNILSNATVSNDIVSVFLPEDDG